MTSVKKKHNRKYWSVSQVVVKVSIIKHLS